MPCEIGGYSERNWPTFSLRFSCGVAGVFDEEVKNRCVVAGNCCLGLAQFAHFVATRCLAFHWQRVLSWQFGSEPLWRGVCR
jgi:hypothetical protein